METQITLEFLAAVLLFAVLVGSIFKATKHARSQYGRDLREAQLDLVRSKRIFRIAHRRYNGAVRRARRKYLAAEKAYENRLSEKRKAHKAAQSIGLRTTVYASESGPVTLNGYTVSTAWGTLDLDETTFAYLSYANDFESTPPRKLDLFEVRKLRGTPFINVEYLLPRSNFDGARDACVLLSRPQARSVAMICSANSLHALRICKRINRTAKDATNLSRYREKEVMKAKQELDSVVNESKPVIDLFHTLQIAIAANHEVLQAEKLVAEATDKLQVIINKNKDRHGGWTKRS